MLVQLRVRLLSPQPPIKKISPRRVYRCQWKLGDVFPSTTEELNALEYVQTDFTRYENRFWPVDMTRPQEDIAEKSKINYEVDDYGFLPQYRILLLNTSAKVIPKNLIYIGNFPNAKRPPKEFIPHAKTNLLAVAWKRFDETFETKMIKQFCNHNRRELAVYKGTPVS